jgi:hypothetical protein
MGGAAVQKDMQAVDLYGGLGRNRTTDTRIFNTRGGARLKL